MGVRNVRYGMQTRVTAAAAAGWGGVDSHTIYSIIFGSQEALLYKPTLQPVIVGCLNNSVSRDTSPKLA